MLHRPFSEVQSWLHLRTETTFRHYNEGRIKERGAKMLTSDAVGNWAKRLEKHFKKHREHCIEFSYFILTYRDMKPESRKTSVARQRLGKHYSRSNELTHVFMTTVNKRGN
jgi:hypothetical protein